MKLFICRATSASEFRFPKLSSPTQFEEAAIDRPLPRMLRGQISAMTIQAQGLHHRQFRSFNRRAETSISPPTVAEAYAGGTQVILSGSEHTYGKRGLVPTAKIQTNTTATHPAAA